MCNTLNGAFLLAELNDARAILLLYSFTSFKQNASSMVARCGYMDILRDGGLRCLKLHNIVASIK